MYKTKPIDYTGCDPVIAEHLKRGDRVLCNMSKDDLTIDETLKKYILGWDEHSREYIVSGTNTRKRYRLAKPVELTPYVKKASEIVKWLEDNGCKYDDMRGKFVNIEKDIFFSPSMFAWCGKVLPDDGGGWEWRDEWLEYR